MADLFLNGRFVPADQACISVMDRGFLFGDAVYEVIPAYGGQAFRLQQHLDRLDSSLAAIGMASPMDHKHWQGILERLLAQSPGADQQVYLQVTRGAYGKRSHAIPHTVKPTVMAVAMPLPERDADTVEQGIAAITLDDIRWRRCDIKTTNLLPNILGQQRARESGAQEAILIRDGLAGEGTASNLFIVRNGLIITPPKSADLLPGVTRDLVLELARGADMGYSEAVIDVAELEAAEEIWITSSSREVTPVTRLNGRPVGNGTPGPVWQHVNELFTACKARLRMAGGQQAPCR